MKILSTTLILLTSSLLSVGMAQTDLRSTSTPSWTYILDRIHRLTGLDTLFAIASIENVPAPSANIPFLEKELEGKTAIKVTFKRGRLRLNSVPPGLEDKYDDRQFVVLFDADARKLLSVTSRISRKDPDIHPERPLREIETEFRNAGEMYQSFPTSDPKITFLKALENVEGFGAPLLSQEIDGFYVVHLESDVPRSEWIITLRGFPPSIATNGPAPTWSRNHMRSFVDATTGKWLGATSNPEPSK
jgi:hypothetical protein